jgi:hypothetical protein
MELKWSSVTKLIHETPEDYIPNVETGINFYLDGDSRYKISIAFNLCFSEGIPFDLELQILTLKGNIKWVRSLGQAVFLKEYAKSIWNFSGY